MRLRAVALGTIVLVACSGARNAATAPSLPIGAPTTVAPGPSQYAALYTNAVAPADAAITTFDARASALTNTASIGDLSRIATPLAATLDGVDHRLLAIAWPAPLDRDVHAMVAADAAVVADLRNVPNQTARSIPALKRRFSSDLSALTGRVATIIGDLAPATPSA